MVAKLRLSQQVSRQMVRPAEFCIDFFCPFLISESWWRKCQKSLNALVQHKWFGIFIYSVIILNTICLALDHHNEPVELERVLKSLNWIFLAIYIIEAIVKLIALGPLTYLKSAWERFELLIVVLSLLELGLEGVAGLSIFRAFRLVSISCRWSH